MALPCRSGHLRNDAAGTGKDLSIKLTGKVFLITLV